MSDLSALMQVAPGTAGYMLGQNQRQSRDTEALRQQELQAIIQARMQEAQQNQQMNPLLLEKQRLGNQGLSAGLPGIYAESLQKTLGAQLAQQTQMDAVAGTNAVNQGKVREERAKSTEHFEGFLASTGDQLSTVPPAMRMQALTAQLQSGGLDPKTPLAQQWLQRLSQMDPNAMPKYLKDLSNQLGQRRAQQSPGYHQATEVARIGAAERRYATDKRLEASKYSADQSTARATKAAEAKTEQAKAIDIASAAAAGKITYEKAASYYKIKAITEPDAELKKQYESYAEAFGNEALKKSQAPRAGTPDPASLGIETVAPATSGLGSQPATGQTKSGVKYKIVQ